MSYQKGEVSRWWPRWPKETQVANTCSGDPLTTHHRHHLDRTESAALLKAGSAERLTGSSLDFRASKPPTREPSTRQDALQLLSSAQYLWLHLIWLSPDPTPPPPSWERAHARRELAVPGSYRWVDGWQRANHTGGPQSSTCLVPTELNVNQGTGSFTSKIINQALRPLGKGWEFTGWKKCI